MAGKPQHDPLPTALRAVICPSAGPCCYEVGCEVRDEALDRLGPAADRFFQARNDRYLLDLWAANSAQLVEAGVPRQNIHATGVCTICGAPASGAKGSCGATT